MSTNRNITLIIAVPLLLILFYVDKTEEVRICEQTGATQTRCSCLGIVYDESPIQKTWIDDVLEKSGTPIYRTWTMHRQHVSYVLACGGSTICHNSTLMFAAELNPATLRSRFSEKQLTDLAKAFADADRHRQEDILTQLKTPAPPVGAPAGPGP